MEAQNSTQSDHAAGLIRRGYVEVESHGWIRRGMRVRHVGDQWPAAYSRGTGDVEGIFVRRGDDVELIVKSDTDHFGSRYRFLADYHVRSIDG